MNQEKIKIQEIEDLKKNERNNYLEISFFLLVLIIIYAITITILWQKQKITWSDTGGLVLEKWAYISLSVITGLVILTFLAGLVGMISVFYDRLKMSCLAFKLLEKELKKTNPEILEKKFIPEEEFDLS